MRRLFYLTILLTIATVSTAQSVVDTAGVTIIFTRGYTGHPFRLSSLTGRTVYDGSMPKAATYINSYREYIPAEKFALINFGEAPSREYALYPVDVNSKIRNYMKYDTAAVIIRGGITFGFVELGRNTRANRRIIEKSRNHYHPDILVGFADPDYRGIENDDSTVIVNNALGELGVLMAGSGKSISFKKVDLSLFHGDINYERYFAEEQARARFFFSEPLAVTHVLMESREGLFGPDVWSCVLNRFQKETTGAEISIAAPFENRQRRIEAGEISFSDVYSAFPSQDKLSLIVVEITGGEIKLFLENLYAGRYNRVQSAEQNMVKTYRDRNGTVRLHSSVRLHSLSGFEYTVNITRQEGGRVAIISSGTEKFDVKRRYRVAISSDLLHPSPNTIAALCGLTDAELRTRIISESEEDYRILLRLWLEEQYELDTSIDDNWKIVPGEWASVIAERERGVLLK